MRQFKHSTALAVVSILISSIFQSNSAFAYDITNPFDPAKVAAQQAQSDQFRQQMEEEDQAYQRKLPKRNASWQDIRCFVLWA